MEATELTPEQKAELDLIDNAKTLDELNEGQTSRQAVAYGSGTCWLYPSGNPDKTAYASPRSNE